MGTINITLSRVIQIRKKSKSQEHKEINFEKEEKDNLKYFIGHILKNRRSGLTSLMVGTIKPLKLQEQIKQYENPYVWAEKHPLFKKISTELKLTNLEKNLKMLSQKLKGLENKKNRLLKRKISKKFNVSKKHKEIEALRIKIFKIEKRIESSKNEITKLQEIEKVLII